MMSCLLIAMLSAHMGLAQLTEPLGHLGPLCHHSCILSQRMPAGPCCAVQLSAGQAAGSCCPSDQGVLTHWCVCAVDERDYPKKGDSKEDSNVHLALDTALVEEVRLPCAAP